jgi:hypothetical protein
MKALTKILGFAVAALIVVALGFYFIEVYAPTPANSTLSAAIQQNSIPIGSMTREFLEYVPDDISPHSPLVIVLARRLCSAAEVRSAAQYRLPVMSILMSREPTGSCFSDVPGAASHEHVCGSTSPHSHRA